METMQIISILVVVFIVFFVFGIMLRSRASQPGSTSVTTPPSDLPPVDDYPDAVAEVAAGRKIHAVKLYMEQSGVGLKEAKDAVEAYIAQGTWPDATLSAAREAGPVASYPDVLDALQRGVKIEAIKLYREHSGAGLKEAKDAVEAYERDHL